MTPQQIEAMKQALEALEKLWSIIDDIDTYSDMAKADDKLYRTLVERRQRMRFKETGITTDGYKLSGGAITALEEALAQTERPVDCKRCNRLEDALKRANGLAEHFERAWYLRGDEIERLTAQPEQIPPSAYSNTHQPEQEPVAHWSDCAVHSEPAYPKGECDCGGYTPPKPSPATDEDMKIYKAIADNYTTPPQRTEQEPVACKSLCELCVKRGYTFCANAVKTTPIPFPPQRTWVGLSKEQLATTDWSADFRAGALWAEAKLKEKNT